MKPISLAQYSRVFIRSMSSSSAGVHRHPGRRILRRHRRRQRLRQRGTMLVWDDTRRQVWGTPSCLSSECQLSHCLHPTSCHHDTSDRSEGRHLVCPLECQLSHCLQPTSYYYDSSNSFNSLAIISFVKRYNHCITSFQDEEPESTLRSLINNSFVVSFLILWARNTRNNILFRFINATLYTLLILGH